MSNTNRCDTIEQTRLRIAALQKKLEKLTEPDDTEKWAILEKNNKSLKKCPFCGSHAQLTLDYGKSLRNPPIVVSCYMGDSCGASIEIYRGMRPEKQSFQMWLVAAVARWNARTKA